MQNLRKRVVEWTEQLEVSLIDIQHGIEAFQKGKDGLSLEDGYAHLTDQIGKMSKTIMDMQTEIANTIGAACTKAKEERSVRELGFGGGNG